METQVGGVVFNIIFGVAGFLIGAFVLKAIFKMNRIVELLESILQRLEPESEQKKPFFAGH